MATSESSVEIMPLTLNHTPPAPVMFNESKCKMINIENKLLFPELCFTKVFKQKFLDKGMSSF